MAERLVDRNLVVGPPADGLAREDLADLGSDVAIVDETRLFRFQELRPLAQHAFAAVGNEARPDNEILVHFDGPGEAGSNHVHVRSRTHPA